MSSFIIVPIIVPQILKGDISNGSTLRDIHVRPVKGMEHVPNIFMSFDKYLFLEVINIVI